VSNGSRDTGWQTASKQQPFLDFPFFPSGVVLGGIFLPMPWQAWQAWVPPTEKIPIKWAFLQLLRNWIGSRIWMEHLCVKEPKHCQLPGNWDQQMAELTSTLYFLQYLCIRWSDLHFLWVTSSSQRFSVNNLNWGSLYHTFLQSCPRRSNLVQSKYTKLL